MSIKIHHMAGVSNDMRQTTGFNHKILGLGFVQKVLLFDGLNVCHFVG